MKILLLSPLPPPSGGIASWTKRFLKTRTANNHKVTVVNTAIVGSRVENLSKLNFYEELKRSSKIIKELLYQLKDNTHDIVHLNTPCSKFGMLRDILCAVLVKRYNVKLVVHCRCDVSYMVNNRFSKILYKKLVNYADKVITLNTASQNYTLKNCNKDSEIIPNFISNEISHRKGEYNVSKKISTILFAGHITKGKGCDLILKAAEYFPQIRIKMVGYLSNEIKNLKKPSNVEFVGDVSKEEVLNQMRSADLFLFPTLTEGFPNVVLEAMSTGLPIISTPVGAIPDMIEEQGGVLIHDSKVSSFVYCISRLENNHEIRKKMSNWNINKVKDQYTEEKVMKKLFSMYERLLVR